MTKHNYIPGKAYKMRNGEKVFYIGENPMDEYFPCVFAMEKSDSIRCRTDGSYCYSGPTTPHKCDIIGEWPPEPKNVKGWMNVYPPKQYQTLAIAHCVFETKEECDNQAGAKNRIACISIEFTEGEGL